MNYLIPAPSHNQPFRVGMLIVTEDTKGNRFYLNDKIKSCQLNPQEILFYIKDAHDVGKHFGKRGEISQPNFIVQFAIAKIKESMQKEKESLDTDEADFISFNEVYCVVDVDNNLIEKPSGTTKSLLVTAYDEIDKAAKEYPNVKFNLIVSNECFEIWYILHFAELTEPLYRNKSAEGKKIRTDKGNNIENLQYNYLGVNNKSHKRYFDKLQKLPNSSEEEAIKRAKNLVARSTQNCPCENPSTDMYILIERLNEFAR